MTTVVQTSYPQPSGYPPPQQQGYSTTAYPQPGYPAQPATFIQVPPPQATTTTTTTGTATPGSSPKYNKKAGLVTGILQIIAGAVLIIFGIVLFAIGSWFTVGWNIWGGICFYVVTGILGVVSKNQNRCPIIAYMVMCILSAICAGSEMIYDSSAASISAHMELEYCGYHYTGNSYGYGNFSYYAEGCSRQKAIVAMHSLSALAALGEMIIAIVASAYCCCGVCGGSTPSQTTVVTYAQPVQTGQVTVMSTSSYPVPGPAAGPQPGAYPQGQPAMNTHPPAYSQGQQQQQAFTQPPANYEEPK